MKRKSYIVSIAIVISLIFCSCGIKQNSTSDRVAIDPKASLNTENTKQKNSNAMELKNDDFGVVFNNTLISVTDNPHKMIESWGRGKAKDDAEAFIGTDPSAKYRRYEYYYLKDNNLGIKVHVRRGEIDYIYFMEVTDWSTNRDVRKGDSYSKMMEAYGKPTKENIEDSELVCEYHLKHLSLMFRFDNDRNISNIIIWNHVEN